MTEHLGRIVGNTIVQESAPSLPEVARVVVHLEEAGVRAPREARTREPGVMKGQIEMSDDFDDIPPGFEDYTA